MKKQIACLAAASAIAASMPALAQQPQPQPAPQAQPAPQGAQKKVVIPRGMFFKGQRDGEWLAKDRLIGLNVRNKDGVVIGDIEDLIFDRNNTVIGVIMGAGGLLGVGERKLGVQIGALQITRKDDGKTLVVMPGATKEILTAAAPYERAQPRRTLVDRAKEAAKSVGDRGKDAASGAAGAAKDAAGKARDAVTGGEKKQ